LDHQIEGRLSHAFLKISEEFISDTKKRTFPYLFTMPDNGLVRLAFDGKSCSGGMADDSNHSDRILLKSFIRITDRSDDMVLEVGDPPDVIYNGEISNIVEKAIDRDVPP